MANVPALIQANWPTFTANGLTRPTTYQQLATASYDANAGTVSHVVVSSTVLEMVWDDFSNKRQTKFDDSTILSIDRVVIFPSLDLPVEPSTNDRVVDDSSDVWNVVQIAGDPAEGHYELHVRPVDE